MTSCCEQTHPLRPLAPHACFPAAAHPQAPPLRSHSRRSRCASRDALARLLLAAAAARSSSSTAMVPHLRCAMASTSSLENLPGNDD